MLPKFIISHNFQHIYHTQKPRLLFSVHETRGNVQLFIEDWPDDSHPEHGQHYDEHAEIAGQAKQFYIDYLNNDDNFQF
jgi:hypothetical protein